MKKFELKSIGVGSVLRFYFALGLVIGLIGAIILLATGATPASMGLDLSFFKQVHGMVFTVLTAILCSILYGFLCGLAGLIGAIIYNIFAAAVGGISISLLDKE